MKATVDDGWNSPLGRAYLRARNGTWKLYHEIKGVEYWYDRHERCWYVMRIDQEGNQIGNSINAYTKREILISARHLSETGAGL